MSLKRTPLFGLHERLGARLVGFGGFEMPVMYSSVLEEHAAVRERVGLFDVSHMSNLWISGDACVENLNHALTCDAGNVPEHGTKYTCMLRDDGTILDDLYLFHTPHGMHLVPNAGMNGVVVERLNALGSAKVEDVTAGTCILALQGPNAEATLEGFLGRSFSDLKRFWLTDAPELGDRAFVSRTGYTGEDGFELTFPATEAERVFEGLLKAGEPHGIRPCGLGARDTLRLEKGFCLAGNEFEGGRTPLEAGLSWLIHWDHDFAGKDAILKQKEAGPKVKLTPLKLTGRGIPRHGNPVTKDGREVGVVTSGTMSPILKTGIALAYVDTALSKAGETMDVVIRDKPVPATVAKLPFA